MTSAQIPNQRTIHKPPRQVIHAGEFLFTGAPTMIETLLGSCIAITMWHPDKKLGGMCHYALPNPSPDFEDKGRLNARYALDCILLFNKQITRQGLLKSDMVVKVFGGGDMSKTYELKEADAEDRTPIGHKNAAAAFEHLSSHDYSIQVADIGEFGYRKVKFDLATGDVWVKFVGEKK